MKQASVVLVGLIGLSALWLGRQAIALEEAPAPGPRYTAEGELLWPEGFERWVFVGASIGLSYSESVPNRSGPGIFHHVYLHPAAYEHFERTGEFPERTMLVLELHSPGEKVAPSEHGYFEDKRLAVEVALKDSERFPETSWAYFDFGTDKVSAKAFAAERCHACHAEHAATDHVFTQFYPVLRRLQEARK